MSKAAMMSCAITASCDTVGRDGGALKIQRNTVLHLGCVPGDLHAVGLGSCCLNWSAEPSRDRNLMELV